MLLPRPFIGYIHRHKVMTLFLVLRKEMIKKKYSITSKESHFVVLNSVLEQCLYTLINHFIRTWKTSYLLFDHRIICQQHHAQNHVNTGQELQFTLNIRMGKIVTVPWLLVPDGLICVFQKGFSYVFTTFHSSHSLDRIV